MPKFNVGDRVLYGEHSGTILGIFRDHLAAVQFDFPHEAKEDVPMMVGALPEGNNHGGKFLVLKGKGGWYGFEHLVLIEPIPEPEPVFEPTAFLFCQEGKPGFHGKALGMKFVIHRELELSWHQTLEAAELRRIELTNGHNDNVHMYVRVD